MTLSPLEQCTSATVGPQPLSQCDSAWPNLMPVPVTAQDELASDTV